MGKRTLKQGIKMKKKIAVLFGGYSGEFNISAQSGSIASQYLSRVKYQVYPILISKEKWVFIDVNKDEYFIDKNDFSLNINQQKIVFDGIFIAIHGTPGEDGKLQGYFDMLGIRYSSCDQATSSLTFNKYMSLGFVKSLNTVRTARSIFVNRNIPLHTVPLGDLQFPVFVKPNNGGSSVGMSKVKKNDDLQDAIDRALNEDNEILIEEFIEGREITCGVFQYQGEIITLPIAEIVSKNEYFDFEAKYDPNLAEEIVPANIPDDTALQTSHLSVELYKKLNCRGIVRFDYIFNNKGIFFLEVNTIPGLTEASIVPKMIAANRMELETFFGMLVEEMLNY